MKIQRSNDCVQITLFDNGVGIPEDHYDNLKLEGFTFGKARGTGLGHTLCFSKN